MVVNNEVKFYWTRVTIHNLELFDYLPDTKDHVLTMISVWIVIDHCNI